MKISTIQIRKFRSIAELNPDLGRINLPDDIVAIRDTLNPRIQPRYEESPDSK